MVAAVGFRSTIKNMLKKTIQTKGNIYRAVLNWRTTPVNYIIASSVQMLHNRRLRSTLPNRISNQKSNRDAIRWSGTNSNEYHQDQHFKQWFSDTVIGPKERNQF